MRRTDVITVVSIFGIILAIAGLHLSGRPDWAGYGIQGLMLLAALAVVVRLLLGRKNSVTGPMADSGSTLNDLYLGTTYTGPRHVAQPQEQQMSLVIDDDERQRFLEALDGADPRSHGGSAGRDSP
ncbi:hypothetical protein E4J89_18840 [Arthrobacter sp. CAU 1506]|uniref:hypothetical protein n=1 Tax=Arthrobacter sp. CAU 1506 TaxID=2560052 RepID=UPI0010AD1BDF|nr:hypothetical protein [Arthrobacter sp. CAU 1506]TJY64075.1 hypothetical protein E4J89_18840 [Arthrobacter sp. CAU 1506]